MPPTTLLRQFGNRVRRLREGKGWSQTELAAKAALHPTQISLIERAQRGARLDTLGRLADALGVVPAELLSNARTTMSPPMHADRAELDRLMPYLREYQALATRHGIDDVFQDNGGKLLQTLILLNLTKLPRREGNDATDAEGNEYELKTVNTRLTQSFSTHHHLNPTIVKKYREVKAWFFSLYEHIELVKIYRLLPAQLEARFFAKWEQKWNASRKDINNPKIPVSFVEQNGVLVYDRVTS